MGMLTISGRVSLRSGRIQRYRVGLGLTGRIQPNKLGKIVNPFSNLFYKFRTNSNSNKIWISMTSSGTIKFKNTTSHKEKYATASMQQIIIKLNI
jgi:hypothetical protein